MNLRPVLTTDSSMAPGCKRPRATRAIAMRLTVSVLVLFAVIRPDTAGAQAERPQPPDDSLVEITRGVQFGGSPTDPLRLNIYKPKGREVGRPAVVLVHGGSWTQGDPDKMDQQGKLLAQQGWVGYSISYRLAVNGTASWPANLEDVRAAVRWVGEHGREQGADPTRIALLGESAGGHLAALVATSGFGLDPGTIADPAKAPRIRAVATFSAPLALAELVPPAEGVPPSSCGDDEACRSFWQLPLVPGMLGCRPDQCPATYVAASPAAQVTRTTPPMYLANATEEIVPMDQVERMKATLTQHGVPVKAMPVEGAKHGNEYTARVWNEMVPFLAESLGVPTPQPILFSEERELKDYLLLIFVGLFAIGLLFVFILAAVRGKWDEPGA